MSELRTTTRCPTCGSVVYVNTADEGTSSYVSPHEGPQGNQPISTTYEVVASVLRNMAELVEEGDSFEGSIEYALPDVPEWAQLGEPEPEGYEHPDVMLRAVFRIGNSMGQGGVRVFGTIGGAP